MDRFQTKQPSLQITVPRPSSRPPRLRRPPVATRGPRWYEKAKQTLHTGGPGAPPPGFVTGTTSGDEWTWYWASMRALDPLRDPRIPPFYGGQLWQFQSPELGGYTRALGSAVVDFLYELSYPPLVVRIVTYYWHYAAPAAQQAFDLMQRAQLAGHFDLVDVPSQAYIGDQSGETAVVLLKQTLGLVRVQDPLTAGTVRLVRNPIGR